MHESDGDRDRDRELQCPACGWLGELQDFDLVELPGAAQVHCPSCDANLGTREHALKLAA